VHIQLLSDEPAHGKHGNTKSQPWSGHGSEEGQLLPTATNLAESFLEAEPTEEKEELQAAISSQSHILQKSSSFTDEEDEELGLGNETMSLPSFVAGFLKGVADRLQLKIKDVAVRLDMELKQDGLSKRHPEDKPDIVGGLLTVGEIDVHGASDFTAGADEPLPMREGKRLMSLADIDLGLVSDPAVFSNYARFTVPASPTTTMQSKESQSSSRAFSPPPPLESSDSDIGLAMTRSTIFEPSLALGFGSAMDPGLDGSTFSHETISHDGRFSDADSDTEHRYDRYPHDSQILGDDDPFHDNPGYLDSVIDTQFDDFDDEPPATHTQRWQIAESGDSSYHLGLAFRSNPGLAVSTDLGQSGIASQTGSFHGPHAYSSHEESHSQLVFGSDIAPQSPEEQHAEEVLSTSQPTFPRAPQHESAPPSEAGSASTEGGAHLTESKYFSHDEAQSLYMSAMSQGTGESFIPNMPGAWDSFHPGEKAGSLTEDRKMETKPVDDTHIINKERDEFPASTPKLNVPADSYFDEQRAESQIESQSAATDRASTPSSPVLRKEREIRKPIFNVDKILIWLPSSSDEAESDVAVPSMPAERTESDPKDLLSSIRDPIVEESMFASKSTRLSKGSTESRLSTGRKHADHQHVHIDSQGLAVEIFAVSVHFDIATGWLLVKAGQRLGQILSGDEKVPSRKQNLPDQSTQQKPTQQTALKLDVHKISVKFIEHVAGHSYPLETAATPPPPPFTSMEDIVLQVTASGLAVQLAANEKRTSLHLDISKFAFGIASDDLISFNESLKMRESTRDINTPSQGDISLSLTKSAESAKVDVSTLPLHVNLNIQHLEEVLGWMGGLSTILELGSSMSSTSTMRGAQKPPKKRPRGVHFETPAPAAHKDPQASVPWKVNARLGGVVLDVTGETHYLNLSTTAVKIVSRFEGIGVQIDKARLSGPHPLDDMSDAPAKVTLTNIRVEFLFSPKEVDLDRLLTLITPSKDKYDDDDDIMLDTLLRQRRQGSVLRVTVAGMKTVISSTAGLAPLASLGSELGRLSTVTKYLPEDDRPGILVLTLVREFETHLHVGGDVGDINAHLTNVEVAWISMPSLTATQIGSLVVTRNHKEELVGVALVSSKEKAPIAPRPPVLMARFIPDEMDPTFKIKLHRLRVEYTIPSVMAFLGLGQAMTGGELAGEMANSIAHLAEHSDRIAGASAFSPSRSEASGASSKPTKLAVVFQDCVLGLNPRNSPAKGLVVLTNSKFSGTLHGDESSEATLDIRKASIMIIDNEANAGSADNLRQRTSAVTQSDQIQEYIAQGYVPVSSISTATAVVKMMRLAEDGANSLDVELRNRLLILETCADSTQTLISILNGLQPPTPPSVTLKYRTEVTPIQDMLASFSGNAFNADPSFTSGEKIDPALDLGGIPEEEELANDELEYVSDFYPKQQDSSIGDVNIESPAMGGNNELFDSFHSQYHVSSSLTELDFREDHFAKQSAVGGTAHRWDSTENTYGLSNDNKLQKSPLRVRVRDVHVIWNLFDGYDWQRTRDTISKAVEDVEIKATERRARTSRMSPAAEEEEESVIGDFLFNSIYIGIPANKDPRELHREINRDINDLTSETGSYATSTTVTGATARQGRSVSGREKKRLRLHRSKHHKMTFEMSGICADLVVFPPGSEETQSSLDVRVKDLEIYDHVPTSTWKKFATYLHEAGERESGTSMVHLEILTVKPIPELAASEIVLKVSDMQHLFFLRSN
jgi:autophagy-related protein 2